MSLNKQNISTLVLSCLPLLLGASCATVQPPTELVVARAEYQKASDGPTSKLNPAGLYEAKKSLDTANQAFDQDPKSDRTRDVSYIALRKVQLAQAQANIESANLEKIKAGQDKQKTTEVALDQTRTKLSDSEERLNRSNEALQSSNQQLDSEKQSRLDADKQGRLDADKQAHQNTARQNADRQAGEATANLNRIGLVRQEQRGVVITLSDGILFTSGQSTLLRNARPKLDEVAQALKRTDGNDFVVEGYSDSIGSESFTQDLSVRRAYSVRDYLVARGISSEKIKAVGYGKSRPIAENDTAEGRANNRRVEIVILPNQPTS